MLDEKEDDFGMGPSMLRPWVSDSPQGGWKSVFAEWFDNSFDADAGRIACTLESRSLTVEDDGVGTDKLKSMQSPGRSERHPTTKSGMYGVGGVRSQVYASAGTPTAVLSTTKGKTSFMEIDWNECISSGKFAYKVFTEELVGGKPGTVITIPHCRWRPSQTDLDRLFREMSYLFATRLREGKKIVFDINGVITSLRPYRHPAFCKRVPIDFQIDGHRITGFCGMIKEGQANPYHGWSVFFGHRVLMRTQEPGAGKDVKRLYGEIMLPESWKEVSSYKDNFTKEVPELWGRIGEICAELIDESDQEGQEYELTTSTKLAESILCDALGQMKKVKGRRPERGQSQGTRTPTGNGTSPTNFNKSQDGEKEGTTADPEHLPNADLKALRVPDRIAIKWDHIEDPYEIDVTTTGRRTIQLRINKDVAQIYSLRDQPMALAIVAATFISHEHDTFPEKVSPVLNFRKDAGFKDCLMQIIGRMNLEVLQTA